MAQARAGIECGASDVGDAVRDGHTRKPGAGIERIFTDAGNTGRDRDAPSPAARTLDEHRQLLVIHHPVHTGIFGIRQIHGNRRQTSAGIKRMAPYAGDTGGYISAGQAGAAKECIVPDAGHASGNRDAGQSGGKLERVVAYAGDTCRYRHAR